MTKRWSMMSAGAVGILQAAQVTARSWARAVTHASQAECKQPSRRGVPSACSSSAEQNTQRVLAHERAAVGDASESGPPPSAAAV